MNKLIALYTRNNNWFTTVRELPNIYRSHPTRITNVPIELITNYKIRIFPKNLRGASNLDRGAVRG